VLLSIFALLAFGGFMALGLWQLERRTWKLNLIAQVDQRVHAAPEALPPPNQWPRANTAADAYRRVRAEGTFLAKPPTLVQAVTELGAGFWVLAPLQLADGSLVLVNRGFVPATARERANVPAAPGPVVGLLRMTEPDGAFLRKNDPATSRWYSRDVHAIAAAQGLHAGVAPYFIDQEAVPADTGNGPVGGLTVIAFSNSHLVYALTWFTLALMVLGAVWLFVRHERKAP
jgi:surfeit locus 1 family protein